MSSTRLPEGTEALALSQAAKYLVEECRMVLPGVQALFGFQLIAVFSERFAKALSHGEQQLHLGAIVLVALAVALIMTPAAYHRMTDPARVTGHFVRISSRLLMAAMPLVAVALALDCYLVARMICSTHTAALMATGVFATYIALWVAWPALARWQRAHR